MYICSKCGKNSLDLSDKVLKKARWKLSDAVLCDVCNKKAYERAMIKELSKDIDNGWNKNAVIDKRKF